MSTYAGKRHACARVREHDFGRRALAYALLAGCAACGKTDGAIQPPVPGAIELTTETSGFMKDDGYELLVDGESQGTIGADDELTISELEPGTYQVSLGDVAENCAVDAVSVDVEEETTASVALSVVCEHSEPEPYTVRYSRERPNLDNGEIHECPFSICSTEEEWDLYVYNSAQTTPHSIIRQNQGTGVEIAHVTGVSLESLSEQDLAGASFTTELIGDAFDADRVILIRTDAGAVYALSNPSEDTTAQTLTFDAALVAAPPQ